MLGDRKLKNILSAPFQLRHYKSLWNMSRLANDRFRTFSMYLTAKGRYPYACAIKTPTGTVEPILYSYYDLLTLNEIFFREDYKVTPTDAVIVDIGSNIGLSGLYFLTRTDNSSVYLYEPDKRNVERLMRNLSSFQGRFFIHESAVSDVTGTVDFFVDEPSGRYGGLEIDFGKKIKVNCVHINSVLEKILAKEKKIDVLKIDVEGAEEKIFTAIDPKWFKKIKTIYLEWTPNRELMPVAFKQTQRGTVCQIKNVRFHG